jgi:hypothetical protein
MIQYKYLKDSYANISQDVVLKISDVTSCVPNDENNRDWRAYQEWLEEGNTPLPADE